MAIQEFIELFKSDPAPLTVRAEIGQSGRATYWRKPMHGLFRLIGMSVVAMAAAALIPRESNVRFTHFESTNGEGGETKFEALPDSLGLRDESFLLVEKSLRGSLNQQKAAWQVPATVNPQFFRKAYTTPDAPGEVPDTVRAPHKSLA